MENIRLLTEYFEQLPKAELAALKKASDLLGKLLHKQRLGKKLTKQELAAFNKVIEDYKIAKGKNNKNT